MAHMKFSYVKDKKHPFLSFLTWLMGIGYATSALSALSCIFYGSNFITGDRWQDFTIFVVVFVCCLIVQNIAFCSLNKKELPEEQTDTPARVPQTTIINTEQPKKKRFCKYCGQEIDQITKKCTGCGKQYFVFKRLFRPAFYCLLIVSIIANIVMGIVISDYKYEYEITSKDLEEAKGKAESYREKAGYLDNHIAFTTDNGTRYHMYSCWHLKDNHDNMWTVEEVKRAGYQKCLDCH